MRAMRKKERQVTDPAAIMGQVSEKEFHFPPEMVKATAVYRIKANNLTVKVNE